MESGSPVAAAKAALRTALAARLAALSPATRALEAKAAAARLRRLPEVAAARRIFTCLSFGDELDTWELVGGWLAEGREVFVPRADRRDGRLHWHRYPCELSRLAFGLRQPSRPKPGELAATGLPDAAVDATVDVAIVLGLGFDRAGFRLGYGSGFFDRFLVGRTFPAIGLAFDTQLVERLPVAPHDLPLAGVVTATETIRRGR